MRAGKHLIKPNTPFREVALSILTLYEHCRGHENCISHLHLHLCMSYTAHTIFYYIWSVRSTPYGLRRNSSRQYWKAVRCSQFVRNISHSGGACPSISGGVRSMLNVVKCSANHVRFNYGVRRSELDNLPRGWHRFKISKLLIKIIWTALVWRKLTST